MKATGIVRRIDDLGRVVIPKEIRRTMRIREGDPMEIYTEGDGSVVFKKYSVVGQMREGGGEICQALKAQSGKTAIIVDRDRCVFSSSAGLVDMSVSKELSHIVDSRNIYIHRENPLFAFDNNERTVAVCAPVVTYGDVIGAVCLLFKEDNRTVTADDISLAAFTAKYLSVSEEN